MRGGSVLASAPFALTGIGCLYIILSTRMIDETAVLSSLEKAHDCLEQKTAKLDANRLWQQFTSAVQMCSVSERLNIEPFENSDETKYLLMPLKRQEEECTIISFGIGFDVDAELHLKRALPHCDFFGADPFNKTNADLFHKVGKFFNIAVGGRNGTLEANVLEGKRGETGLYRLITVPSLDLGTFLRKYLPKRRVIDLMIIDIEHNEYEMLPFILEDGRLARDGVVVCQINIEIHDATEEEKQQFFSFYRRALAERRYSMLIASSFAGHIRLFMINRGDEACARRYISDEESNVIQPRVRRSSRIH